MKPQQPTAESSRCCAVAGKWKLYIIKKFEYRLEPRVSCDKTTSSASRVCVVTKEVQY